MPEFSPCVGSFSLVLWQRLSKFPFQPCFEESDSTGIWTVVYLQLKTSNSHLKASFMEWDLYVLQSSSIVMKPKGYKFTIYFRKRKDKQMAIRGKEKKKKKENEVFRPKDRRGKLKSAVKQRGKWGHRVSQGDGACTCHICPRMQKPKSLGHMQKKSPPCWGQHCCPTGYTRGTLQMSMSFLLFTLYPSWKTL